MAEQRDGVGMKRAYLAAWDLVLRPFRRIAWFNPNYLLCVQIVPAQPQSQVQHD